MFKKVKLIVGAGYSLKKTLSLLVDFPFKKVGTDLSGIKSYEHCKIPDMIFLGTFESLMGELNWHPFFLRVI